MKSLDIRDISIIDAFPVYAHENTVLNIGCGEGRIDYYLASMGYRVYATDIARKDTWKDSELLSFHESDIFDLSSFPVHSASGVICSQTLEHIKEYQAALTNLIILAKTRLIITVPYRKSFFSAKHCNFWSDGASGKFKDIHEFNKLCTPYMVAISKTRTKPEDVERHQYNYLVIIDKRQNLNGGYNG